MERGLLWGAFVFALIMTVVAEASGITWLVWLTIFYGLIMGWLAVSRKESVTFILSILAISVGSGLLGALIPSPIQTFFNALLGVFAPTLIFVGFKGVFKVFKK
ncbi:MAG: hypothetical protein ACE5KE_04570 [Methanosarcinales archaeon]